MPLETLPALSRDKPQLQAGKGYTSDCPCLHGDPVQGGGTVGRTEVTSFIRARVH